MPVVSTSYRTGWPSRRVSLRPRRATNKYTPFFSQCLIQKITKHGIAKRTNQQPRRPTPREPKPSNLNRSKSVCIATHTAAQIFAWTASHALGDCGPLRRLPADYAGGTPMLGSNVERFVFRETLRPTRTGYRTRLRSKAPAMRSNGGGERGATGAGAPGDPTTARAGTGAGAPGDANDEGEAPPPPLRERRPKATHGHRRGRKSKARPAMRNSHKAHFALPASLRLHASRLRGSAGGREERAAAAKWGGSLETRPFRITWGPIGRGRGLPWLGRFPDWGARRARPALPRQARRIPANGG